MRPVKARRAAARLPLLAFVVVLVLKGAIPGLAAWSAHLQGKGVAEVCDVYGVALPGQAAHGTHGMLDQPGLHAMHAMPSERPGEAPPHRHDPGSHAGDHCVLSGLVAFAGAAGDMRVLPAEPRLDLLHVLAWRAGPVGVDAAARWASLLGHGPPALS